VLDSTAEILKLASNCEADDLCVCLISGGGSALLEKPVGDISLDQFCDVTSLLSHQGATIEELNLVRRQLSQVKGGGLARTVNARNVVTLIVSDVIGDRLDIIASGPTVCDSKDVGQRELNAKAKAILLKFDPDLDNVPSAIMAVLNSNSGSSSNGNESGDEGGDASSVVETSVRNIVIGNNETAVAAAVAKATELGYACESETNELDGDVEMLAEKFAGRLFNQLIKSSRDLGETSSRELSSGSRCFISGGEPTVTIDSESGQGGRNQHLTLATMLKFIAQKGESKNPIVTESEGCSGEQFCFLSAGTDGEDGNVAVAGAQFDQALVDKVMQANLSSKAINSLQSFDSYSFLDRVGAIIKMASTRTNVCDLRVVISRFPKHSSDLPLR
jgi:hydroxypyruvate reductase